MRQCDPRLMTPRKIVSELASILASEPPEPFVVDHFRGLGTGGEIVAV